MLIIIIHTYIHIGILYPIKKSNLKFKYVAFFFFYRDQVMDFGKPYYHFCSSDFDTLLHTAVYIQSLLSYTLIDCRNHCSIFFTLPEHLIILSSINGFPCFIYGSLFFLPALLS